MYPLLSLSVWLMSMEPIEVDAHDLAQLLYGEPDKRTPPESFVHDCQKVLDDSHEMGLTAESADGKFILINAGRCVAASTIGDMQHTESLFCQARIRGAEYAAKQADAAITGCDA